MRLSLRKVASQRRSRSWKSTLPTTLVWYQSYGPATRVTPGRETTADGQTLVRYDVLVNGLRLRQASGVLGAPDLDAINALLAK